MFMYSVNNFEVFNYGVGFVIVEFFFGLFKKFVNNFVLVQELDGEFLIYFVGYGSIVVLLLCYGYEDVGVQDVILYILKGVEFFYVYYGCNDIECSRSMYMIRMEIYDFVVYFGFDNVISMFLILFD